MQISTNKMHHFILTILLSANEMQLQGLPENLTTETLNRLQDNFYNLFVIVIGVPLLFITFNKRNRAHIQNNTKATFSFFKDIYHLNIGKYFSIKHSTKGFAFLVHSRSYEDIYRKYPYAKKFPKPLMLWIMKTLPPITLSRITGLQNQKDNVEVRGYVLGITMTASQMMLDRQKALRKIRQATYLAKGKGLNIVGLGGLTASLSKGGMDLLDIPKVNLTTGHAYTAYNVTQYVYALQNRSRIPLDKLSIAIVGAAGSVGSLCGLLVAQYGFKNIVLIDTKHRFKELNLLKENIYTINESISVEVTNNIHGIKGIDFVITATNASHALVTIDLVHPGMILVDDAQPSDIHFDVLSLPDVLAIEAGVVFTPGIKSNFNYGLKSTTDNFCCMAELLILAAHEWKGHFVINRATLEQVELISQMGKVLGFEIGKFQNFKESISCDKIDYVLSLARKRHGISI